MFLVGVPAAKRSRNQSQHDLAAARVAGLLVVLPDAVQADAVGPLPVVPALGVDDAAVVQAQQELAGAVLDLDQIADQQLDLRVDGGGVDAVGQVGHESLLAIQSR